MRASIDRSWLPVLRGARAATLVVLALALVAGCVTVDRSRPTVRQLNIHGVRQIPEGDLRDRIATHPTSRILGIRLPWVAPEYYDETTYRRDLDRIVRFYRARGYYSAAIATSRVEPAPEPRAVDIDITLREGPPTTVETIWISGCEPVPYAGEDRYAVSSETCDRIRTETQLHLGSVFSEALFEADRRLMVDLLKEEGHALARVEPHATVDPVTQRAHLVYVLLPGPVAQFGRVQICEGSVCPGRNGNLPSEYPIRPAWRAVDISRGQPYSLTALADAQRRLFQLGVFGMVRITEEPHRCDSHGRCDAARDVNDHVEAVRVDLRVQVSGIQRWRFRFGGGGQVDQTRADVHLLASFEHRNFLGGMRQLRAEARPVLFISSLINGQGLVFGGVGSVELRFPEVWRGGSLVTSVYGDVGPDPYNPYLTNRGKLSAALGAQHRFARDLQGSIFLRSTYVGYFGSDPLLDLDPIFRASYVTQAYTYLEQSLAWDRRDNVVRPTRGTFASVIFHESVAFPPVNAYSFVRVSAEFRGYVPLGAGFTIAARGLAGAAFGWGEGVGGWPLPQELRFFSGGANSNRGYSYNRVGYLTTIPEQGCMIPNPMAPTDPFARVPTDVTHCRVSNAGPPFPIEPGANNQARADLNRITNVGGLAGWDFSVELRWYLGNFGLTAFFDASDVFGWQPPLVQPTRPAAVGLRAPVSPNFPGDQGPPVPLAPIQPANLFATGQVPPPQNDPFAASNTTPRRGWWDPHPSSGIGVRYVTPVGVVRLDLGLRLDDLGCTRFNNEIARQNQFALQNGGQYPWYYVVSRPQCELFGFLIPFPLAVSLGIGEAF